MKQNILLNQQQEKDKQKTDIELKKLTEEIKKFMEEKHKSETNIDQNPLSLNETENATKQIKQLVEDKKEIEIQKQQVEADLLTERQKREGKNIRSISITAIYSLPIKLKQKQWELNCLCELSVYSNDQDDGLL